MSVIVVGIDFSQGSLCALRLAIDVANRCGYDVELVNVQKKNISNEAKTTLSEKLENIVIEYKSKLRTNNLTYIIKKGIVSQELALEAKKLTADMIVLGTHGLSNNSKSHVGSNAFYTINEAKCPVLTVRADFNFDKKLEKIVIPIDSSESTRQKIPFAANMANIFGSEVWLLGLYTSKMSEIKRMVNYYVSQGKEFFVKEGVPNSTEFLEANNVTKTTLQFAESIHADLIIIMKDQETTFSNIFKGSYTKQMLKASPIPVLCIHPEEINRAAR